MNTQDTQYLQNMVDTAVAALEDVKAKDIVISVWVCMVSFLGWQNE